MRRFIAGLMVVLAALSLITTSVFAENTAPIAQSFEFETYRGVSYGGTLSAVDPDGDELRFEITTQPTKGSVKLSDDGSFVYSPYDGEKGRDYFGFKAIDSEGKRSQEATVIIKLVKQKSSINYADMQDDARHCAAVFLSECAAYTGEMLGGQYYFHPNNTVTRGEFLSMCMSVCGNELLSGVVNTGFYDDDAIDNSLKACVSTAVRDGIVKGYYRDGHCVFDADAEISTAEAMVILDRTLALNEVAYIDCTAAPAWAAQSAANLSAMDISGNVVCGNSPLSRGEAAEMLYAASHNCS